MTDPSYFLKIADSCINGNFAKLTEEERRRVVTTEYGFIVTDAPHKAEHIMANMVYGHELRETVRFLVREIAARRAGIRIDLATDLLARIEKEEARFKDNQHVNEFDPLS